MQRVRLIHWNEAEAAERAARLRAAGYEVDGEPFGPDALRALRDDPPDAVVIDLGRVPSQGRDVAVGLRIHKATRFVPLVFAGGAPQKVARVADLLPDATYTGWDEIGEALAQAITHPPADPVVPESTMAGYAGTPLPKKLGIKVNSQVALVGAPAGFERTLGRLPEGARVHRGPGAPADLTLWFVRSRRELERDVEAMVPSAAGGGLWIIWPKKSSGVDSDLSQPVVREVAMAAGLVDFKISSVDATWSGLRFSRREPGA